MRYGVPERVITGVERLSGATLDVESLIGEAGRLIRRSIPYDNACWHTMDPATLTETSSYLDRAPRIALAACAELEYLHEDYNKYARLARSPRRSGVLSEATGGVLDRSIRYRDIYRSINALGELRAAFVVDGLCWGCVTFGREAPHDFDADERDLMHQLTESLGRAFRGTLITQPTDVEFVAHAPGMILFNGRTEVESMTAEARLWLDELREEGAEGGLPYALLSVMNKARAQKADAMSRVPGRSGRWVTLHASLASGGEPGRVAVILQGASPASIAPLIAAAHGFTDRERELVQLVLQGFDTADIADRLYISPLTVQGHLKSIFAKTGVRSRRELVGQIFVRHYQPRMADPVGGTIIRDTRRSSGR